MELYIAAASARCRRRPKRAAPGRALVDAGAQPLPPGCGPCIGLGRRPARARRGRHLAPPTATSRAAWAPATRSATWPARRWWPPRRVAGYIRRARSRRPRRAARAPLRNREVAARAGAGEGRDPAGLSRTDSSGRARLPAAGQPQHRRHLRQGLHLPRRHDPASRWPGSSMDNYDPEFAAARPGPATSSSAAATSAPARSREQAVTALQAAGSPLVDRRQLLADLPAQRLQQRLHLPREPRPGQGDEGRLRPAREVRRQDHRHRRHAHPRLRPRRRPLARHGVRLRRPRHAQCRRSSWRAAWRTRCGGRWATAERQRFRDRGKGGRGAALSSDPPARRPRTRPDAD